MAWDKDKPASPTSLRASNPEMLANNAAIETALNREHEFSTGGTVVDQTHHKKGSARCFIQDGVPGTRRDGQAFTAEDNGSLWIDTNSSPDNAFYKLIDYSDPTVGNGWILVSTEIIETLLAVARVFGSTLGVTSDFAVNTDKFTVAAATGNTLVAGAFESTGVATLADASATKTTAAPGADAQIANKKYIDDQITATIAGAGFYKNSGAALNGGAAYGPLTAGTYVEVDVSAIVGSNRALCYLRVQNTTAGDSTCTIRDRDESTNWGHDDFDKPSAARCFAEQNEYGAIVAPCNASGKLEITSDQSGDTWKVWLMGYVK
jgi:hypothetical protein